MSYDEKYLPDDIYHVWKVVNGYHSPAGRFLVHGGNANILEDNYDNWLANHLGPGFVDETTTHWVNNPPPDMVICSDLAYRNGHAIDSIPDLDLADPYNELQNDDSRVKEAATGVIPPDNDQNFWHYWKEGWDQPHMLEYHPDKDVFHLDGNELSDNEVQTIQDSVTNGTGTLKYDDFMRAERYFSDLIKKESWEEPADELEMTPQEALAHMEKLYAANPTPELAATIKSVRNHIFVDPHTKLGNKYAHEEWKRENPTPGGVHVGLDLNGLKHLNDNFGHEAGDQAIRGFGGTIRESLKGIQGAKAWRTGGDEAALHFPTKEHAFLFSRNLQTNLGKVPAIGGQFPLSTSLGIGHDIPSADKALYEAKKQKIHPVTGEKIHPSKLPPVLGHSMLSESPGPMPHLADNKAA